MVLGDIGEVALKLKTEGSEQVWTKAGFNVFRPVILMLAQTAQTVKEALTVKAVNLLLSTSTTAPEYRFTSKTAM